MANEIESPVASIAVSPTVLSKTQVPVHDLSKKDALLAMLAGLAAFCLYLATLHPGLTEIGDASKFAFVGRVLGIPHAPGYPLYVLVSHVFSYLPWGTLAYRMNALSGLFGAVAVAFGYVLCRQLGVRRVLALATALALAGGNAFWAKSLYAKTYTLNAALVSAGIMFLLRWGRGRRPRDLYWSIAIFALSLGNHLTVLAVLPALLLYALVTDWRASLQKQTLLVLCLSIVIGLSQYGLILIRTRQHVTYVEAPASTLPQLWAVMTARRFVHEIGAYSPAVFVSTRLGVVAGLIRTELGLTGLALLVIGGLALLRRHSRDGALLGMGAIGVAALTSAMGSEEDQGFLLLPFVLSWPIIGVGLETVAAAARHVRPALGVLLVVAALGLPLYQIVHNYSVNDHHAETFETAYFNALFAILPAKTAIIIDEYRINMMVLYKLLGERAGGARDIRSVPADLAIITRMRGEGFQILAFEQGRRELARFGVLATPFEAAAAADTQALFQHRPVFLVRSVKPCFDVASRGWVDLGDLAGSKGRLTVRLDNFHPFDAELTAYVGSDRALDPTLAGSSGAGTPALRIERFDQRDAQAGARLAALTSGDHVVLPEPVRQSPFLSRVEVRVNDQGDYSLFGLDLGQGAGPAIARAIVDRNGEPRRAHVCWHPLADLDVWPQDRPGVTFPPDAATIEFASGWAPVELAPSGEKFRWMSDHATVVVPLEHPRPAVISIAAHAVDYPGRPAAAVTITVNGHRLAQQPLPVGGAVLAWTVPAEQWRTGLNSLVFDVLGAIRPSAAGLSTDNRLLGMNITSIEFRQLN